MNEDYKITEGYDAFLEAQQRPMVDVAAYESTIKELRIERESMKALITELCDALELPFEEWTDQSELIQRGREATR